MANFSMVVDAPPARPSRTEPSARPSRMLVITSQPCWGKLRQLLTASPSTEGDTIQLQSSINFRLLAQEITPIYECGNREHQQSSQLWHITNMPSLLCDTKRDTSVPSKIYANSSRPPLVSPIILKQWRITNNTLPGKLMHIILRDKLVRD